MGYRMITGDELMKKFEEQVKEQKISLELDKVQDITPADGIFKVHTATDATYQARAIILAPGKTTEKTWCRRRGTFSWQGPVGLFDL